MKDNTTSAFQNTFRMLLTHVIVIVLIALIVFSGTETDTQLVEKKTHRNTVEIIEECTQYGNTEICNKTKIETEAIILWD